MQFACRHHLRFGLWSHFEGGKNNNRNNPYKNNRDPTCWLGPLIKKITPLKLVCFNAVNNAFN
jgi:hypothetical protein